MNKRLYWTSRETNFDKEIWCETSPGCCGSMWFPYATQFLTKFPRIAVRVFWLMVKLSEALNIFITNYPPVCPNLLCQQCNQQS